MKNTYLVILVLIASSFSSINAQEKLVSKPLEFKIWTGYSFNSIYFLGKTRDSKSFITGIGFQKPIRKYKDGAFLFYTADIIPYLHYNYPKRDENDRKVDNTGFGISPIGFMLQKAVDRNWIFELSVSGSFILMKDIFPTDKGRKLNFTFDPSVSINRKIIQSFYIEGGYKFHHISNAQTGKENPGLDSNFLYLSLILK